MAQLNKTHGQDFMGANRRSYERRTNLQKVILVWNRESAKFVNKHLSNGIWLRGSSLVNFKLN